MRVPFDDKVWSGRSDDGEPGDTRRVFNQVARFAGGQLADDTPVLVAFV
jgi:formiminoglutamase